MATWPSSLILIFLPLSGVKVASGYARLFARANGQKITDEMEGKK
jgi:hypothetical protein